MKIYFTDQFHIFKLADSEKSSWNGGHRFDYYGLPSASGEFHYMNLEELLEEESAQHDLYIVSPDGNIPDYILNEFKLSRKVITVIIAEEFKLQPGDLGVNCSNDSFGFSFSISYATPEVLPEWAREQEADFAEPKDKLQSHYDVELHPREDAIKVDDQTYVGLYSYTNSVPIRGTGKLDHGYWDGDFETEHWDGILVFRRDQPIEVLFKTKNRMDVIEEFHVEEHEALFNLLEDSDDEEDVVYVTEYRLKIK